MRLTTWNCSQKTDRRIPFLLERLAPDIAVVPESSQRPHVATASLHERGTPHAWTGRHPTRGLGIYAPGAERLEVIPPGSANVARHGLAVRATFEAGTATVLGLWTVPYPGEPRRTRYLRAVQEVLAQYDDLLEDGNTIVAGDFNVGAQVNGDDFSELLAAIEQGYGLRSAYHSHHGVDPGDEVDMTHWHQRNQERGFHIDLILVPDAWQVTSATVGTFADWGQESDHAPVSAHLVATR